MTETILCVSRDGLPASWMQQTAVVPLDSAEFFHQCGQARPRFVRRSIAEQTPACKQIIPYVVLQTHDARHTAVYLRRGREARLHDLWSLGIGGHVTSQDGSLENGLEPLVTAGLTRELSEELLSRPAADGLHFCGVINEDLSSVGQVHLGVVYLIRTRTPDVCLPGPELHSFHWHDTRDLLAIHLETWSGMALELLPEPKDCT